MNFRKGDMEAYVARMFKNSASMPDLSLRKHLFDTLKLEHPTSVGWRANVTQGVGNPGGKLVSLYLMKGLGKFRRKGQGHASRVYEWART